MKPFHGTNILGIRAAVLRWCKIPDPAWQVTVQNPAYLNGMFIAPGYVQIDDVTGGRNNWSKGVNTLRLEGYNCPDFSLLKSGRYTWADAVARLEKIQDEKQSR